MLNNHAYHASLWLRQKLLGGKLLRFSGEVEFDYLDFGNPHGKPVVFLHGFADEKYNFYLAGKILSKKYRVIVPDVPGFGNSTKKQELIYSMENYSRWFLPFIEHHIKRPVHLIGNSLGGAIALQLALDHPHWLQSLTLVDCGGIYPETGTSIYDEFQIGQNIFVFNSEADFDPFLRRVFLKRPFIPAPIKNYYARRMYEQKDWHEKLTVDFLKGGHIDMTFEEKKALAFNNQLKDIKLPCLIIWGEHDSVFPVAIARQIKRDMSHARLEVLKETGHCPQAERPFAFAGLVGKFLSGLS